METIVARIEIDWLETFIAVAEQSSFSQASRFVHRSQSRISAQIAELELALGAVLFDRRHRPIELTDAGETFLDYARTSMREIAHGSDAVASLTGVLRGRVVLGCHASISAGFLPNLLKQFTGAYPQIQVELSEDTTAGIGDSLAAGRTHLAIRSMASNLPEGLTAQPLWREPYAVVVRANSPIATLPLPLSPRVLEKEELVVIARPESGVEPDTAQVLQHWSLAPQISWRTEQPQTLANLIKAGLGTGLINVLAMEVCETTGLEILPVGDANDGRVLGLWRDPTRYLSSAARALHDAILAAPIPAIAIAL